MELLRSITVDSVPSPTALAKFALVESLKALRTLLLSYPLNLLFLSLLLFLLVRRITSIVKTKQQFRAVYDPLPHIDSPLEELKLIKKEVRAVQVDLIAVIKQRQQGQPVEGAEGEKGMQEEQGSVSAETSAFLEQASGKSAVLEEVERELNETSKKALEQICKISAALSDIS